MKTEWDVESAISTYNVDGWGSGYFTVNSAGNVETRPLQENGGAIEFWPSLMKRANAGSASPSSSVFRTSSAIALNRLTARFKRRSPSLVTAALIEVSFR